MVVSNIYNYELNNIALQKNGIARDDSDNTIISITWYLTDSGILKVRVDTTDINETEEPT